MHRPFAPPTPEFRMTEHSGRRRVVLVDFGVSHGEALEATLTAYGFDVKAIVHPSGAVHQIRAWIPDALVVLLDASVDGIHAVGDALRDLRSDPLTRRVPSLAIVAENLEHDLDLLLEMGFSEALSQPVNEVDVLLAVRRLSRGALARF
jgi:CheY-like chemotaxis protein